MEFATRKIPNSYKFKDNQLTSLHDSLEILILGSSHAYMGLDPQHFTSKTFNAANVSQPLCFDHYIAQKFIDRLPNLKYIILPISYFTLSSTFANTEEWYREIYYTLYMDYPKYGLFSKQHYEMSNFSTANSKLIDYYIRGQDLEQTTSSGMSKMYYLKNKAIKNWDNGEFRAKAHSSKDFSGDIGCENLVYLNNIASLSHEKGVKLILITTPVRSSYSNHIDIDQLNQMYSAVNIIVNKYDNVSYFDFFKDTSYVDEDFYDSDHLTEYGAYKLSHTIDSLISVSF